MSRSLWRDVKKQKFKRGIDTKIKEIVNPSKKIVTSEEAKACSIQEIKKNVASKRREARSKGPKRRNIRLWADGASFRESCIKTSNKEEDC